VIILWYVKADLGKPWSLQCFPVAVRLPDIFDNHNNRRLHAIPSASHAALAPQRLEGMFVSLGRQFDDLSVLAERVNPSRGFHDNLHPGSHL
jgi:hypothetical protein